MSNKTSTNAIRAEAWKTILSANARVWFAGMVQSSELHFVLGTDEALISVTVPRRSPFAVIDESYTSTLRNAFPPQPTPTWKIWNSPLVQSLGSSVLFHEVEEEQKFSYFIATEDECIEVIGPEPRFEVLKTRDVGAALQALAKP